MRLPAFQEVPTDACNKTVGHFITTHEEWPKRLLGEIKEERLRYSVEEDTG